MNKAAFLDRDGTINVDKDFVYRIEDLEFLPGSIEALKNFQKKGFLLIIVTNQSGIGRGYYTEKHYKELMKEFHKKLKENKIKITAEYYCMHAPEENCDCRKPNQKLIKEAVKKYEIDAANSYFIGDKTSDILAGKKAGMKSVLVMTGKAGKDKQYVAKPDLICKDLFEASEVIY